MSRSEQAHDAAAAWIIRRENSDWSEQDQAAFDGWLAESDGNRAAYWRLKHSWNEADRIGSLGMRRSEEHTSELQSLMRISYAVFCLKKKTPTTLQTRTNVNNQTNT